MRPTSWCGAQDARPPIVSIVAPFWGYLLASLYMDLVKPKKGTTMETIGRVETVWVSSRFQGLGFQASGIRNLDLRIKASKAFGL